MTKDYQYNYSKIMDSVFDLESRVRKAKTILSIIMDAAQYPLKEMRVLDVGASAGIIDRYLAEHFGKVFGIDIDSHAIKYATKESTSENLSFAVGDALNIPFESSFFDIVICSHVYEHVTDPVQMFTEIHRVLKVGGVCYFAAGNRIMFNEPHYNLPLLTLMPRPLSHLYMRLSGKGRYYHEKHLTFWGLKNLVNNFERTDYTLKCISRPKKYGIDYMISPNSMKHMIAVMVLRFFYWASPGYIWLLKKNR